MSDAQRLREIENEIGRLMKERDRLMEPGPVYRDAGMAALKRRFPDGGYTSDDVIETLGLYAKALDETRTFYIEQNEGLQKRLVDALLTPQH